jgi:UPF0755 protein
MAAGSAVDLMLRPGSRERRRVTIPEGLRSWEVLDRLAEATGLGVADLRRAAARPDRLGLPGYARGGLEGLLFPATYDVAPRTSAPQLLAAMVARFKQAAAAVGLDPGAGRVRLSPMEVITVASIVQAEGGREADYPKIARVIYNRLARGGMLQMDTTVLYAQRRRSLRMSESDTRFASPYNTYRHRGLPPGPIANPGEPALAAALSPAKGDWYWFVTTDPTRRITKFTDKESEFVVFREEMNKHLGPG